MKKIRQQVFETNSSSSHSISLGTDKEFVLDTILPDDRGIIVISGDDFGWEFFKHNDALTKASYAYTDGVSEELLKQVILDQTDAEDVIFVNSGYIDHQSYGTSPTTYEELRQFIFNKNSWLFGGNDNQDIYRSFYDVPEYTDDQVIPVTYRFELEVEGYSETVPFQRYPSEDELIEAVGEIVPTYSYEGYFYSEYRCDIIQLDLVLMRIPLVKWQEVAKRAVKLYADGNSHSIYREFERKILKDHEDEYVKWVNFSINEIR